MAYQMDPVRFRGMMKRVLPVVLGLAVMGAPHCVRADSGPTFGNVDLNKIQQSYNKRADLEKNLQQIGDSLSSAMKVQAASDMLTVDEQKQLGQLLVKANPSDADRAAIAKLQSQSRDLANELVGLQQKQNLSDTEKARLESLTKKQQGGKAALDQVNADYTQQVQQAQEKASNQFADIVKAAIASVAKEKNLSVVFESGVAVYTANDITDDVVKKLNK